MRFASALTLALVVAAPAAAQDRELSAFAWLAGTWETTEATNPPSQTDEHWLAPSGNLMIGTSQTVKSGRTTAFEFMRLEKRGADIYYVPQPNGRPPVDFKLTSAEGGSFVFENSEGVDRVRRVEYRREGADGLYARIEGAQNGKPFLLEYRYRRR
jgi:hypothetical protein